MKNAHVMSLDDNLRFKTTVETPTRDLKRKLHTFDPAELRPHPNNSRQHSVAQIESLCRSLSRFGFVKPVVVDEENTILAGHGIVEAALALSMKRVPVARVTGLTADEKRAYVIADNRLAELSSWDEDLLALELSDLRALDFDLSSIGYELRQDDDMSTDLDQPDPQTQHQCPKCGYEF